VTLAAHEHLIGVITDLKSIDASSDVFDLLFTTHRLLIIKVGSTLGKDIAVLAGAPRIDWRPATNRSRYAGLSLDTVAHIDKRNKALAYSDIESAAFVRGIRGVLQARILVKAGGRAWYFRMTYGRWTPSRAEIGNAMHLLETTLGSKVVFKGL